MIQELIENSETDSDDNLDPYIRKELRKRINSKKNTEPIGLIDTLYSKNSKDFITNMNDISDIFTLCHIPKNIIIDDIPLQFQRPNIDSTTFKTFISLLKSDNYDTNIKNNIIKIIQQYNITDKSWLEILLDKEEFEIISEYYNYQSTIPDVSIECTTIEELRDLYIYTKKIRHYCFFLLFWRFFVSFLNIYIELLCIFLNLYIELFNS
jgi:hypothetical protein